MMKEKKFFPSIFNDVLAPSTQGPSSSNTVGPYRIGRIARGMIDGKPEYIKFEMSRKGGFYDTFFSMQSDKGLLSGILGQDLIRDDLSKVYDLACEEGLDYEFEFADRIEKIPTEMGELTIRSDKETLVLTGISLGGGEILIRDVNGETVNLQGREEMDFVPKGCKNPRRLPSVYPLRTKHDAKPPFDTSEGMVRYAKTTGKSMWQVALDYECEVTGCTEDEILKIAEETLETEYRAIRHGYEDDFSFDGITVPKAQDIKEKIEKTKLIPSGIGDKAGLDALAIMEYSNSHGIIVCMPTGGATGIIPSAIRRTAEEMKLSKADEVHALLVAGLLGTFYYPTHYHGALGCQAEVGIATSMASGALASMITDDPEAIERAAVLGMQVLLGQVCDPVLGYAQVPCFIRNIASVSIASVCANYGVLGIDTAITLDEMVQAVLRVGEALRGTRINDLGCCGCSFSCHPESSVYKDKK